MSKNFWIQAIKYGIVGVLNTLLTALAIWVMMHFVFKVRGDGDVSSTVMTVSNTVGYIVGIINSFLWNRFWTFKSKRSWKVDFLKFILAFLVCFIPQLILVNLLNKYVPLNSIDFTILNKHFVISFAYICQLIGMVFYTVLNFLMNKYYTFRK